MNKIVNSRGYKRVEGDEVEEKRMNEKIINNNINITYYIYLNYTYLI